MQIKEAANETGSFYHLPKDIRRNDPHSPNDEQRENVQRIRCIEQRAEQGVAQAGFTTV